MSATKWAKCTGRRLQHASGTDIFLNLLLLPHSLYRMLTFSNDRAVCQLKHRCIENLSVPKLSGDEQLLKSATHKPCCHKMPSKCGRDQKCEVQRN